MKTTKLKCKVKKIVNDHVGRRVQVEFDDGDSQGPWTQWFMIKDVGRPFSMEEFKVVLAQSKIERPIDPLENIKQEVDHEFEIDLPVAESGPVIDETDPSLVA